MESSCYRWDYTSFPGNPAVIGGFLKLSMVSTCYRCVPYTKSADRHIGSYTHRLYIQNFYNDCQLLNVYCYKHPPLTQLILIFLTLQLYFQSLYLTLTGTACIKPVDGRY